MFAEGASLARRSLSASSGDASVAISPSLALVFAFDRFETRIEPFKLTLD
jgi:hypothetical protein